MAEQITTLTNRLNEILKIKGITQMELSELTGIGIGAINHYVKGYNNPNKDRIAIISKALNINPAWLLGYDAPMENITKVEIIFREIDKLDDEKLEKIRAYTDKLLSIRKQQNELKELKSPNG